MYPSELKYTKDHEWIRLDGGEARVGITEYAQKQLGDVVFLELPDVGRVLARRFVGARRSRGSLAVLARAVTGFAPTGNAQ